MAGRSGIALITTLLVSVVLFIMVVALIESVRAEKFLALDYTNKAQALYTAEAGVAVALDNLRINQGWQTDQLNQPLVGGQGSYTIQFNTALSNVGPDQSVNNLLGVAAVDGPRGPSSVNPQTADIVVIANYNGTQRKLEVLLGPTGLPLAAAVESTGKIKLSDNLTINGVTSLNTIPAVPYAAGILSTNTAGATGTIISWTGGPGLQANVSGTVGVSGPNTVIDFTSQANGGTATLNGNPPTQTDAPAQPFPPVDIAATLAANGGHPAPPLSPGVTTLSGSQYSYNGDLTLDGDLNLKNATKLYVSGNLVVNGAISGTGSVYVGGTTSFSGNAYYQSGQDNAALYSRGTVDLTGYDGATLLNSLSQSNPVAKEAWQDIQQVLPAQQEFLTSGDGDQPTAEEFRKTLGWSFSPGTYDSDMSDETGYLLLELSQVPQSSGRDFLIKKFQGIRDMNSWWQEPPGVSDAVPPIADPSLRTHGPFELPSAAAALANFLATGSHQALIEAGQTGGGTAAQVALVNTTVTAQTLQFNVQEPGNSFFTGLVYTNGGFYSNNAVTVVGALVARDDGSQRPMVINGVTVNPGDLILRSGSGVTFVQDMFSAKGPGPGGGVLGVVAWLDY